MEAYLPLIIQLISGAAGGHIAGKIWKGFSMGALGNTLAGLAGGAAGGWVFDMMGLGPGNSMPAGTENGPGLEALLGSLAAGLVGGGLTTAVIGGLRSMFVR